MWLTGPVAPRHVGSSQTRARTRVPCIGRQTLSHRATREAPFSSFIAEKNGAGSGSGVCPVSKLSGPTQVWRGGVSDSRASSTPNVHRTPCFLSPQCRGDPGSPGPAGSEPSPGAPVALADSPAEGGGGLRAVCQGSCPLNPGTCGPGQPHEVHTMQPAGPSFPGGRVRGLDQGGPTCRGASARVMQGCFLMLK